MFVILAVYQFPLPHACMQVITYIYMHHSCEDCTITENERYI